MQAWGLHIVQPRIPAHEHFEKRDWHDTSSSGHCFDIAAAKAAAAIGPSLRHPLSQRLSMFRNCGLMSGSRLQAGARGLWPTCSQEASQLARSSCRPRTEHHLRWQLPQKSRSSPHPHHPCQSSACARPLGPPSGSRLPKKMQRAPRHTAVLQRSLLAIPTPLVANLLDLLQLQPLCQLVGKLVRHLPVQPGSDMPSLHPAFPLHQLLPQLPSSPGRHLLKPHPHPLPSHPHLHCNPLPGPPTPLQIHPCKVGKLLQPPVDPPALLQQPTCAGNPRRRMGSHPLRACLPSTDSITRTMQQPLLPSCMI